jgi:2'-5' RNA ligase
MLEHVTKIGVAIAVPAPWGPRLQDFRTALGDETATGIPTHITLLPPFEIDGASRHGVESHLKKVAAAHEPFPVLLRGTGTFRPVSPVVFVSVADGISSCEQLAASVRTGPLTAPLDFPYHPHVTVAHHLDDDVLDRAFDELAAFECEFVVDRFSLYVHDVRAGWVPTRDVGLAAGT